MKEKGHQVLIDVQDDGRVVCQSVAGTLVTSWWQRWQQEFCGHQTSAKSPLAKAVGLKKNHPLTVWDLTCGLGHDSLHLLGLAAHVVAFERSPIMQALIKANWAQIKKAYGATLTTPPSGASAPWEERGGHFSFYPGDFISLGPKFLAQQPAPEVFYLDPMFGDEGILRKSLPKKAMQILPQLVGLDEDASTLWQTAFTLAQTYGVGRLVVKRALHAPALGRWDFQIKGKAIRFDVTMITAKH